MADTNQKVLNYLAAKGGESRLDRVAEATGLSSDEILEGAATVRLVVRSTVQPWPLLAPVSPDDEMLLLG